MVVSLTTNADRSFKSKKKAGLQKQLHLDSYFNDTKAVVECAIVFS